MRVAPARPSHDAANRHWRGTCATSVLHCRCAAASPSVVATNRRRSQPGHPGGATLKGTTVVVRPPTGEMVPSIGGGRAVPVVGGVPVVGDVSPGWLKAQELSLELETLTRSVCAAAVETGDAGLRFIAPILCAACEASRSAHAIERMSPVHAASLDFLREYADDGVDAAVRLFVDLRDWRAQRKGASPPSAERPAGMPWCPTMTQEMLTEALVEIVQRAVGDVVPEPLNEHINELVFALFWFAQWHRPSPLPTTAATDIMARVAKRFVESNARHADALAEAVLDAVSEPGRARKDIAARQKRYERAECDPSDAEVAEVIKQAEMLFILSARPIAFMAEQLVDQVHAGEAGAADVAKAFIRGLPLRPHGRSTAARARHERVCRNLRLHIVAALDKHAAPSGRLPKTLTPEMLVQIAMDALGVSSESIAAILEARQLSR